MPRMTTETHDLVLPQPSMVSSAAIVPRSKETRKRNKQTVRDWQQRAWGFHDSTGELRYAATWFGNALSRAVLRPCRRNSDGEIEWITEGEAFDVCTSMTGGMGGQSQMLKAMGMHFFIPGEWYLVGREGEDGEDVFEIIGVEEMKREGDDWYIDYGDGERIDLTEDDTVLRMWNSHPRRRLEADSPVRAVLPTLEEIHLLTQHIAAQARSRLAGAGLLLFPSEISFGSVNGTVASGTDEFLRMLSAVMEEAIANPGSTAAMVPITMKVSGEWIEKVRHLTFWSDLDQQAVSQRDAAIRRLALGIDLPPEVLLGTADVNHWGAWQIDESAIKAHIEPALEVIAAAYTMYLRDVIEDEDVFIVADTSALRLRPNRSKEALELWDRGEITGEALRRETGFDEKDNPKEDERKQTLIRKVASGSATPEQVGAALRLLNIDLQIDYSDEQEGREKRPDPSLEEHPTQEEPEQNDQSRAASAAIVAAHAEEIAEAQLMVACDALCLRAMERVGNRLKNLTQSRPPGVEMHDLHCYVTPRSGNYDTLLEGAWTTLPHLMRGLPFPPAQVARALDAYAKSLIAAKEQHDRDKMMRFVLAALAGEKVPA